MTGIDERLALALSLTLLGVALTIVNVAYALGSYREFRDGRGLRGLVAAFTMAFMILAIIARSPTLREAFPDWLVGFNTVAMVGVAGGLAGLTFSVYTWRSSHHRRDEK